MMKGFCLLLQDFNLKEPAINEKESLFDSDSHIMHLVDFIILGKKFGFGRSL